MQKQKKTKDQNLKAKSKKFWKKSKPAKLISASLPTSSLILLKKIKPDA